MSTSSDSTKPLPQFPGVLKVTAFEIKVNNLCPWTASMTRTGVEDRILESELAGLGIWAPLKFTILLLSSSSSLLTSLTQQRQQQQQQRHGRRSSEVAERCARYWPEEEWKTLDDNWNQMKLQRCVLEEHCHVCTSCCCCCCCCRDKKQYQSSKCNQQCK